MKMVVFTGFCYDGMKTTVFTIKMMDFAIKMMKNDEKR
jgi:N-glycosylase/DNA lyase